MPHRPQDLGWPVQAGGAFSLLTVEAKTDSFLASLVEPHAGHFVPSHFEERTSISESPPHCSQ